MTIPNKKAQGAVTPGASVKSAQQCKLEGKDNKNPTKSIRILRILAEQSLNRYEAERFNDHCLPSTVSTIQQKHGITIARRFETVPGYMGIPTSCCRYWLEPEQKVKAMEILLKKGSKDRETSAYASSGT